MLEVQLSSGSARSIVLVVALLTSALVPFAAGPPALGADLPSLLRSYKRSKVELRGTPKKDQERFVEESLLPVLIEIAGIGDRGSARVLEAEYIAVTDALAVACVKALLECPGEGALSVILAGYSKKSDATRRRILGVLAETKRDLEPVERSMIALLAREKRPEVLPDVARALGNLDTLEGAKALIDSVQSSGGGRNRKRPSGQKSSDRAQRFNAAVVEALKATKSEEVKSWLAGDAFGRGSPDRLVVLSKVVGALKLETARETLVELIDHRTRDVSIAAARALGVVGVGDYAEAVAEYFEKRGRKLDLGMRIEILDTLASSGVKGALAVVLGAVRSSDLTTRTIAVGSLARQPKSVEALGALIRALDDSAYDVRNAALRSLRHFRHKEMVAPLIEHMKREKDEKLRLDALQCLIEVTGKNMGLEVGDWRNWWEVAEPTFDVSSSKKDVTTVRAYDLDYFGLEVTSKRIAFLVDLSSSMIQKVAVKRRSNDASARDDEPGDSGNESKQRKIDVLKRELVRVIEKLPADTLVNIIYFHTTFGSWKKKLRSLKGRGRREAVDYVKKLVNATGTNVFDTLEFALNDKRVDTVFLLTDGNPSQGRITDPQMILQEIGKLNRLRGATIHCVAFGEESDLLKKLAKHNGGVYRFVDSY